MTQDPNEFAARSLSLGEPEHSKWWARASFNGCFHTISPVLVDAAFAALADWSERRFTSSASYEIQGIEGAIRAIAKGIIDSEDDACSLTRRLALQFHSQHIGVAFTAIRQFEAYDLSNYTIFVTDHLVRIASAIDVPVAPTPMSLRGIAFKALFDLDRNFRTWPQLQVAYHECIAGCQAWSEGPVYKTTLQLLLQY